MMRRQAAIDGVGNTDARACKRKIHPDRARTPVEEERRSDIGEEADCRLRHGEHGILARHTIAPVHRNAAASTECIAVDEGDIWLWKAVDCRVHAVLGPEETHHAP